MKITDFTIDCILSKNEKRENSSIPINHPVALNKVLNNNPWIPISPLAHFFNPSSLTKKFPLPNLFCPNPTTEIIENLRRATENHAQSLHNHFYASAHVLELEKSSASHQKSVVYESFFCDARNKSLHSSIQSDLINKSQPLIENKCTTCFKSFENVESLNVSLKVF